MAKQLVVIGGGAKAAAIAARTAVLDSAGLLGDLTVTIVERRHLAANWDGSQGFTNGRQRLVTEPERDVGYPYTRELFGPRVPRETFARYSWAAYCIAGASSMPYHEWLDRGRPHPTNREWARYLTWVIREAQRQSTAVKVTEGSEVVRIWSQRGRLKVRVARRGWYDHLNCDGLVVTGPGPALPLRRPSPPHPRIFNARSFWTDGAIDKDRALPYIVIGSGGAAANVVIELISQRAGPAPAILVMSQSGAIYTRAAGYFERRHASDPQAWRELSAKARLELIERGDRGVVAAGRCSASTKPTASS